MSHLKVRDNGDVVVVDLLTPKMIDENVIREIGNALQKLPLEAAASRKLLLNFRAVEFMSSMMIGHIVRLNKQCKADKIRLTLCNIGPDIMEIFTITKLNKILDICEDEAASIESFKNPRGWFK